MDEELSIWLDEQLFEGRAVVSDAWYMDHGSGARRTATLATQLELPSRIDRFTARVEEYIGKLASQIYRVEGKVINVSKGTETDARAVLELTPEDPALLNLIWQMLHSQNRIVRKVGQTRAVHEVSESRHDFRARFYFNWVNAEDQQKAVKFRTLRYMLFPSHGESICTEEIAKYTMPPYNFRIPPQPDPYENPNYEPDYRVRDFDGLIIASLPTIGKDGRALQYQRVFMDAANVHLEYDTLYAGSKIGFYLIQRLRRAAEKAENEDQLAKKDSEVDLPVLGEA